MLIHHAEICERFPRVLFTDMMDFQLYVLNIGSTFVFAVENLQLKINQMKCETYFREAAVTSHDVTDFSYKTQMGSTVRVISTNP